MIDSKIINDVTCVNAAKQDSSNEKTHAVIKKRILKAINENDSRLVSSHCFLLCFHGKCAFSAGLVRPIYFSHELHGDS